MKHLQQKSLVLFASVLLAIAGALAASLRSRPEPQVNETSPTNYTGNERKPIQSQTQLSIAPQAVGPINAHVIAGGGGTSTRSEEHTSELQSQSNLVCRLLLETKK